MIEKLSPPTDCLYKFMAIVGIVCSIGILIYREYQQSLLSDELKLIQLKYPMSKVRAKVEDMRVSLLNTELDVLVENGKARKDRDMSISKAKDVLKQVSEIYGATGDEIYKAEIELNSLKQKQRNLSIDVAQLFWQSTYFFFISLWGFWMWYYKVQLPNDKILKMKLALMTKEYEGVINKVDNKNETEGNVDENSSNYQGSSEE